MSFMSSYLSSHRRAGLQSGRGTQRGPMVSTHSVNWTLVKPKVGRQALVYRNNSPQLLKTHLVGGGVPRRGPMNIQNNGGRRIQYDDIPLPQSYLSSELDIRFEYDIGMREKEESLLSRRNGGIALSGKRPTPNNQCYTPYEFEKLMLASINATRGLRKTQAVTTSRHTREG